jgi:glucose-1-phosphate adenylyltransferase
VKKNIVAMLLAGGVGSRLNILARERAKPAIPFGSIYRIIDFTMSNIANSHVDVVGVLTQYKPLSLMAHIENGKPWDLFGRTRSVEILPPKTGEVMSDWYKGTSDAVYQNIEFIEDFSPELVLVVSGDHIYNMDYRALIDFHVQNKAHATVCLIKVPKKDSHHFGIASINEHGKITAWEEKPVTPKSNLASMGVYVFKKTSLVRALQAAAKKDGFDFAKDIIPILLKKKRVYGFVFNDYWRDVGTIDAYWQANMDLLSGSSSIDLTTWQVKTNYSVKGEIGDRPSTYFGRNAKIQNSLIARGCVIEGQVINSIISPGVRVHKNAKIIDSIIFHETTVNSGSVINRCIIDKSVKIGTSALLGSGRNLPNRDFPKHLFTGITVVGKKAIIKSAVHIGKNCIVMPGTKVKQSCSSGTTAGVKS